MLKLTNAPVISFRIEFYFKEINDPDLDLVVEIAKHLSDKEYKEKPKVKLNSTRGLDKELFIGPLKFIKKEEGQEILIFRDSIHFHFKKYSEFDLMFPKILDNLSYLAQKLKILQIIRIRIAYIDEFKQFPRTDFNLQRYFTLYIEHPDYSIDYKDFSLGIKLETESEDHISILRIRGKKPKDQTHYLFHLETLYVINEEVDIDPITKLTHLINIAHKELAKNFKTVLSKKTKGLIGLEDE